MNESDFRKIFGDRLRKTYYEKPEILIQTNRITADEIRAIHKAGWNIEMISSTITTDVLEPIMSIKLKEKPKRKPRPKPAPYVPEKGEIKKMGKALDVLEGKKRWWRFR